jgi:iron(III) transport system ATP-binding protein
MTIVKLECVGKTYPGNTHPAVDSITLGVEPGEILTLLGPSGCGKTTLLRLIAGFERPDVGTIEVGGKPVAGGGQWVAPEQRGVGMVFQDYALFPHLTVGKNVRFGLRRLDRAEAEARTMSALEAVGLEHLADRHPHQLSGGQQQRVALARALAGRPDVILLDEPLSNLDADLRKQMRTELKQILEAVGATAVLVTHDQEDCFALADRVAVLREGNVEQIGPAEAVYHEPETRFVANFLGIADFLPGRVAEGRIVTSAGDFESDGELPDGAEVDLLIRPDDVGLTPKSEGLGIITKRSFKGAQMLYTVEIGGLRLHSLGPSYGGLPVGRRVDLEIGVDHLVVFPRGQESRLGKSLVCHT